MRVKSVGVATALAAATLLSSCSSSGSSDKVDRSTFHPNETRFAKPLYAYLVTAGPDYDYAVHLITAKCMAQRGYRITVGDPANYQAAALNISTALSVARAQRYGYHVGPVRGGVTETPLNNLSPTENAAAVTCAKRAESQIGLNLALENDVNALAFTADDAVEADAKVKASAQRWRSCMLPLGIPDLPVVPVLGAMPTKTQHDKFWKAASEPTPSVPAEVRQAVFDAKCRQSSGWDSTYYRAVVDHQFALMDRHTDLLAKASDQKRKVDARVSGALRANGH